MKTLVELAYEKKQTFINIVKSFGCNSSYAEDIVQELFIQIYLDEKKGLDLWYNDDINTYYCYKVLRGIYLNTHKKQARFLKTYIEDIEEIKQATTPFVINWTQHATVNGKKFSESELAVLLAPLMLTQTHKGGTTSINLAKTIITEIEFEEEFRDIDI